MHVKVMANLGSVGSGAGSALEEIGFFEVDGDGAFVSVDGEEVRGLRGEVGGVGGSVGEEGGGGWVPISGIVPSRYFLYLDYVCAQITQKHSRRRSSQYSRQVHDLYARKRQDLSWGCRFIPA